MTNREIIIRIYQIVKPFRWKLAIAMVAMVVVAAMTGAQSYLLKPLVDKVLTERNVFFLKFIPLIILCVFAIKTFANYISSFVLEIVGQTVIRDLRIALFRQIHAQPLSFFNLNPTGTLISRIISDVTLMQQAVSNALVTILQNVCQVLCLLGLVFYMNWRLALLSFTILPLAAVPIIYFGKLFRRLSTKSQEETANVSNILFETISGAQIVKAFSREKYEGKRFTKQISLLFSVTIRNAQFRCMQHPLMEFIGGIAVALIAWFGGMEAIHGKITPGEFIAFIVALISAYDPIKSISKINSIMQQGIAAATRVFAVLDTIPEISDSPGAVEMPPFRESIRFRDVTFAYNTGEPVLHTINLTVRAGETLAIVGASGGGKTTLTNLIPRFLDTTEGQILIDGKEIKEYTISSLRDQIAMVTQQTILFNDTVRHNIAYGNLEASDEDIREAARAAFALSFIEELPDKFDAIIGERGDRLSGGQRQRISIARAILKNAPILILDEATSALDTESEREVQDALENLMRNKTTIVIAHRLSTIKNADRILVMQDGRLVEEGTHQELLALHGEYESLYSMQFS